jgi:hypothetical protein
MPIGSLSGNTQMFPPANNATEVTVSGHSILGTVYAIINLATGYVLWCPAFADQTSKTVLAGSICQPGLGTTSSGRYIADAPYFGGLLVLDETSGKISFCNAYYDLSRLPGKWTYAKCIVEGNMPTASLVGNAMMTETPGVVTNTNLFSDAFTILNGYTGAVTLCPTITSAAGVIKAASCTAPQKAF